MISFKTWLTLALSPYKVGSMSEEKRREYAEEYLAHPVSICPAPAGFSVVYADGRHTPVLALGVDREGGIRPITADLSQTPVQWREGYLGLCKGGDLYADDGYRHRCPACLASNLDQPLEAVVKAFRSDLLVSDEQGPL